MKQPATSPKPFTVIGGFLGAGKTTLLNRILRDARGTRFAVLVNDFGDVNIDVSLIESHDGTTMSLANGCICCSLANGFIKTMIDLMRQPENFDHIVVEASGVSEPAKIMDFARIDRELDPDGIIVLVDATSFNERLVDGKLTSILTNQIRSADLLILNKVDEASAEEIKQVRSSLGELAGGTPVVETSHAAVPLGIVLGVDAGAVQSADDSVPAIDSVHSHAEMLFHTATLTFDRPIERPAFDKFTEEMPSGILRAKGFVNLEGKTFLWQKVGASAQLTPSGNRQCEDTKIVLIGTSEIDDRPLLKLLDPEQVSA
ncbi:MAG: GTP-binding protein [Rhizobiaceae bacterium]